MKKEMQKSVAKTEHRWATLGFSATDSTVTVLQKRNFTFKDYELCMGRWLPELTNIIKTVEV